MALNMLHQRAPVEDVQHLRPLAYAEYGHIVGGVQVKPAFEFNALLAVPVRPR